MERRTVLKNLEYARTQIDTEPENVMVGCIQIINQCGRSVAGWLSRQDRRATLRKQRFTQKKRQALSDLIDFAVSEVLACEVESFWVGALPTRQTYRRTEAHIEAMQKGRARAKRQLQAARNTRLSACGL